MRVGGRTDRRRHFEVTFRNFATRLRTVRCAVEDYVTSPQTAVLQLSVRHGGWCLVKYSNSVAYLCFSWILCSVYSETVL